MVEDHSLDGIRKRAHALNCELFEEGWSARDIEIIGYYLHRIAASYLSFLTHKEYEKSMSHEEMFANKECVVDEEE